MLNWLLLRLINPITDDLIKEMFTKEYSENPYIAITAGQKLTPKAIIEAALRAETEPELVNRINAFLAENPETHYVDFHTHTNETTRLLGIDTRLISNSSALVITLELSFS